MEQLSQRAQQNILENRRAVLSVRGCKFFFFNLVSRQIQSYQLMLQAPGEHWIIAQLQLEFYHNLLREYKQQNGSMKSPKSSNK